MDPIQPGFGGGTWDAFAGVFSPDASELLFSTYLGGSGNEYNPAIFADSRGSLTLAGDTNSGNFPTAGGVQTTPGGGAYDLFVTRIDQIGVRMVTISNATNERPELASETIASGFGIGLASQTLAAPSLPLPTTLDGVTVKVIDSQGVSREAELFFVSEFQINYLVPAGTALGWARVEVCRNGDVVSRDGILVTAISPGIYTANGTGSGPPAARYLLVRGDGSREEDFVFDATKPQGQRTMTPLDLGDEDDQLFIILFVTGSRGAATVTATVGPPGSETATPATGPFPHSVFAGLEQVNIGPIPRSLIASGVVNIKVFFDGQEANTVQVILQ